jgi:hypothetical protein
MLRSVSLIVIEFRGFSEPCDAVIGLQGINADTNDRYFTICRPAVPTE